ncbi:hypothetical protein [Mycobacterium sp. IDR2000157661]|uniref:hypothetical protein n=1 Tax=Mycobacterium sp. IDR2000157661 TaxID=2867005 RepID=UPI001EEA2EC4|nr:hypothetical protein [Mycobacterium sp. IDR2000157661]
MELTLFWPMVREKLDDGDELADLAVEQEQRGKRCVAATRQEGRTDPAAWAPNDTDPKTWPIFRLCANGRIRSRD